jgi:hypothetical protein
MKAHPLGHPDTQSDNAPALVELICALEIVTHEQQRLNRLETSRPKDLGEQDRFGTREEPQGRSPSSVGRQVDEFASVGKNKIQYP